MVLVFFLCFFIILLLSLLFLKLCLTVSFVVEEKHVFKITLKLLKILKYTFYIKLHTDFPKLKVEYIKDNKSKIIFELKKSEVKKDEREIKHYLPLLNRVEFEYINLQLKIGLKDAYKTSMLCGFVNTIVYSTFSVIKHNNKDLEFIYNQTPVFEYPIFNMSLNCIICFRLANIIYEFIKIRRR